MTSLARGAVPCAVAVAAIQSNDVLVQAGTGMMGLSAGW